MRFNGNVMYIYISRSCQDYDQKKQLKTLNYCLLTIISSSCEILWERYL